LGKIALERSKLANEDMAAEHRDIDHMFETNRKREMKAKAVAKPKAKVKAARVSLVAPPPSTALPAAAANSGTAEPPAGAE
jgi:hypothetical protein